MINTMKPYESRIYLYAENEAEVAEFEKAFYNFVNAKREQGIAVNAKKLTEAITKFKDNTFVTNYLR